MKTYRAPWGKTLKWSSALLVLLAVVMAAAASVAIAGVPTWTMILTVGTMPAILLGCVPFVIRGYEIAGDAILIRRLFWTTRLDRAGLKSAEFVPKAMSKSLRTCGNAGGFSFTGWYWGKSLGGFRAFVTDLDRTVVLRFEKQTVVVSPDSPEDFVKALSN
jgi:Bacterial PH domain